MNELTKYVYDVIMRTKTQYQHKTQEQRTNAKCSVNRVHAPRGVGFLGFGATTHFPTMKVLCKQH